MSAPASPDYPAGSETPALLAPMLVALLLLIAFIALASQLTRGFEFWTFESLRRDDAAAGRLRAPPALLASPQGRMPTPWPGRHGEIFLVDFIYTRCPTVCSALGAEYTRMQAALRQRFGAQSPVRLVSIAFDAEHDTPAALQAYAAQHRQDARLWLIASPVDSAQRHRLLRALGVVAVPDGFGGFVHNGAIHLIDADGTLRGIFDLDEWPQALERAIALTADLAA